MAFATPKTMNLRYVIPQLVLCLLAGLAAARPLQTAREPAI